jgi:hypothetical protein
LQIVEVEWLELAGGFGRLFQRVAGSAKSIAHLRKRDGRTFHPGHARLFGSASRVSQR